MKILRIVWLLVASKKPSFRCKTGSPFHRRRSRARTGLRRSDAESSGKARIYAEFQ